MDEGRVTDEHREPPNDPPATPMTSTAEVAAVVRDVQLAHEGRIHWRIGRHTAEQALRAIRGPRRVLRRPSSSKSRRRKKHKRML
jgi:hypothetical protein